MMVRRRIRDWLWATLHWRSDAERAADNEAMVQMLRNAWSDPLTRTTPPDSPEPAGGEDA